ALGTQTVTGGTAALTTSDLSLGDHSITAVFTPTDTASFTTSTSDAITVTIALGTLATGTPAISGTAQVGSQLTVDPGTWTDGTAFAYQWLRDGTAIDGATAATYTATAADAGAQVTAKVTGTKDGFTSATATSAAVT